MGDDGVSGGFFLEKLLDAGGLAEVQDGYPEGAFRECLHVLEDHLHYLFRLHGVGVSGGSVLAALVKPTRPDQVDPEGRVFPEVGYGEKLVVVKLVVGKGDQVLVLGAVVVEKPTLVGKGQAGPLEDRLVLVLVLGYVEGGDHVAGGWHLLLVPHDDDLLAPKKRAGGLLDQHLGCLVDDEQVEGMIGGEEVRDRRGGHEETGAILVEGFPGPVKEFPHGDPGLGLGPHVAKQGEAALFPDPAGVYGMDLLGVRGGGGQHAAVKRPHFLLHGAEFLAQSLDFVSPELKKIRLFLTEFTTKLAQQSLGEDLLERMVERQGGAEKVIATEGCVELGKRLVEGGQVGERALVGEQKFQLVPEIRGVDGLLEDRILRLKDLGCLVQAVEQVAQSFPLGGQVGRA